MPEWADAIFVLGAAIACVVAFRYGAAARPSRDRADAAGRAGRLLMGGGLAASSVAMGTVLSDGTVPALGWALFGLAGVALTSGLALRLGAGWPPGPAVSPARRAARILVTIAFALVGAYTGYEWV